MATITLTPLFSELDDWPGRLFEADAGTTVIARSATEFRFRLGGPETEFPNFRIFVSGTGFKYVQGIPVDGMISQVRVLDASGQTVLTIGNLVPDTIASDLSQFFANVFGSESVPNQVGPGSDGLMAWNHLLSGDDVTTGTAEDDRRGFVGVDAGNDLFDMGAGDDEVNGGIGNDTIHGGDGFDRLSYRETTYNEGGAAFRGATFTLQADGSGSVLDPWGGTDTFTGLEQWEGSRFNDVFHGTDARERFVGLRGNDRFYGGGDNDSDEIRYDADYWSGGRFGIRANLEKSVLNGESRGTVIDGFGNTDTVVNIERVSGTRFNDIFAGSADNNVFWGGEGKDSFNGKGGFDEVRFSRWFGEADPVGVSVDMRRASGQVRNDGFGNVETMINIEKVEGSDANDTLRGNAADNVLAGGGGSDLLQGNGGSDRFEWYDRPNGGDVDRVLDFAATGPADTIDGLGFDSNAFDGMTTTLSLVNGTAAVAAVGTFIYNAGNDTLYWDEDGTGGALAQAIVILNNVAALNAANFALWD